MSGNKSFLREFYEAIEGSVAVEFSLIILPVMVFFFGIAEVMYFSLAQARIDQAAIDVSSLIRSQNTSFESRKSIAQFKTEAQAAACTAVSTMAMSCDENRLHVYVGTVAAVQSTDAHLFSGTNFLVGSVDLNGLASFYYVAIAYNWPGFLPIGRILTGAGSREAGQIRSPVLIARATAPA